MNWVDVASGLERRRYLGSAWAAMWRRIQHWWAERQRSRANPAHSTGVEGERAAARFLTSACGFTVIARNWRRPGDRRDEIDLVCRDGEALVFVEVKTRVSGALVSGYDSIDRRKRKALLRAVRDYLQKIPAERRYTVRFDVVEVERPPAGGTLIVRHFANVAFFPRGFLF